MCAQREDSEAIPALVDRYGNSESPASKVARAAKPRAYYTDWLRATAISLVIFVHSLGLSFDSTGYNVKAGWEIAREKRDGVIKCLVQIGIPMFFYISGIGTTFYKTEKKNAYCLFVWAKVTRIMIPFIVACFVFLIPRLYLGQDFETFTRPEGKIIDNLGEFYIKTIKYNLVTNLSWLWYLPAMFVDFLLTYPVLRWSKRRKAGNPIGKDDSQIIMLLFVTMGCWAAINYFVLPQYANLLVPSIVVLTASQLVYMFSQLLVAKSPHFAMALRLLGPASACMIHFYKDQKINDSVYRIFLMINYDGIAFSQGIVDMIYWDDMIESRNRIMDSAFAGFTSGVFLLAYAVTCPTNYTDVGSLWYYPLMTAYSQQCFYSSGTWLWLYATTWWMHHAANKQFNPTIYHIYCDSALWTYVSHYFWIMVLITLITRPLGLGQPAALFVLFFGTHALCYSTFIGLEKLASLCSKKKPEKEMEPEGSPQEMSALKEALNDDGKGQHVQMITDADIQSSSQTLSSRSGKINFDKIN